MSTGLAVIMNDKELTDEAANSEALFIAFDKIMLEGSFYDYVKAAWHLVEPSGDPFKESTFEDNWHIRTLCKQLEEAYYGRAKRQVINVPPGTAKSLIVMVLFPTWVWARNAKKRFLTASYGQHLTMRDNLRARQIIESPWYQSRWPHVRLMDDQNTKGRYNTTEHGWRIATSVNGQGIGEHPDFILIDDPHTDPQAQSDTERQNALDWFDRTISVRLGRNPAIIVIMQRLHADDLSGHLLAREGWVHVRFPMRFEKCTCPGGECAVDENARCPLHQADLNWKPDPLDPRTEAGDLLFPGLFPEEKVRKMEIDLGPYGTAGQMQQRPSPEGGLLFKREYFAGKFVDTAPKLMRAARGWDTASTPGGGDYTVGVKIAEEFEMIIENGKKHTRSTGRFFIVDVQRDQLGPNDVDKLMHATAELDGKLCAVREEKEGGSAGKAVIEARAKTLKGYNYVGVPISGSKSTRAKPFRAQCEAGNVYLVRGAWNEAYLRELCGFPTGIHDDQVDGSSCAFNAVLLEDPPKQTSIVW